MKVRRGLGPIPPKPSRAGRMLLYFGYTYCPDVCPTTLLDLVAASEATAVLMRRLSFSSASIPPATTPADLAAYTDLFSPLDLHGFTGTPAAQIEAVKDRLGRLCSARHDSAGFHRLPPRSHHPDLPDRSRSTGWSRCFGTARRLPDVIADGHQPPASGAQRCFGPLGQLLTRVGGVHSRLPGRLNPVEDGKRGGLSQSPAKANPRPKEGSKTG